MLFGFYPKITYWCIYEGRPRSQQVFGNIKSKLLADVAPGCPISVSGEPRQKAGGRVEVIETEVDKYSLTL